MELDWFCGIKNSSEEEYMGDDLKDWYEWVMELDWGEGGEELKKIAIIVANGPPIAKT
jgi:hypothetical protein